MNITYSDGSYIQDSTYYDSNGNAIGSVDAEGNIWSNDGNNTFLGNSQAGDDGLPSGGSISSGGSAATSQTSPGPSPSSNNTQAYVADAVAALGDTTGLINGLLGKSPAKTTTTPTTKPAATKTSIYFIIAIVVVIIGCVVAFVATREKD